MLQTGCSVYLKEITNFYFMYLPECTYTGVFMFSHTFLKLPRLHLGCQDDFFFFFPFNFYFCYSRQKISENQFWAETGNKRSLDIFFFHVFSVDFLTEWTLILTLIFAVWWGSFHFDQLHVSVINTSRIPQI